jgi:hypothetical protein
VPIQVNVAAIAVPEDASSTIPARSEGYSA